MCIYIFSRCCVDHSWWQRSFILYISACGKYHEWMMRRKRTVVYNNIDYLSIYWIRQAIAYVYDTVCNTSGCYLLNRIFAVHGAKKDSFIHLLYIMYKTLRSSARLPLIIITIVIITLIIDDFFIKYSNNLMRIITFRHTKTPD